MTISWAQFVGIPNGTRIYNHGADQCVALANHYHEQVIGGQFIPVHSAHQWYTQSWAEINRLYTKSLFPQPGAIFVSQGGIYDRVYGHIGVVTSVNANGSFNTMEQNAGTGSARWTWRFTRPNDNSIWGFLIPKNNPATKPAKLEENQRQAHSSAPVKRREKPTSQSKDLGDWIKPGEVGNFNGWIKGESVSGNNIWFRGISGHWFWSGGFTSQATKGLTDLNPKTPTPPKPEPIPDTQRKAHPEPVNIRKTASTSSAVVGEVKGGAVITPEGWVRGTKVSNNDVWYKISNGYVWGGGFLVSDTRGLKDLNPSKPDPRPEPSPEPEPEPAPEYIPFEAFSPVVTRVEPAHTNNYELDRISSKQTDVVLHDYGTDGKDSFTGTVSWFRNPGANASAHFVVSGGNIVQMVPLNDRAYHAGPTGNNHIGVELDPAVGRPPGDPLRETTILSARKLLKALDKHYGTTLTLRKHPEFMNTECGDDVNLEDYRDVPTPPDEISTGEVAELIAEVKTLTTTLTRIFNI